MKGSNIEEKNLCSPLFSRDYIQTIGIYKKKIKINSNNSYRFTLSFYIFFQETNFYPQIVIWHFKHCSPDDSPPPWIDVDCYSWYET